MFQSESIWSKYANPEVDRLLQEARSTLDEEERIDLYRQVHEILAEDMPSVPLYQVTAIYGASDDLEWTPTANESLFVMDMNWTGE
jgi:peptide/nickel transport system substrate-binding protein